MIYYTVYYHGDAITVCVVVGRDPGPTTKVLPEEG